MAVAWVWVMLGGGLGAVGRYYLSGWINDHFGPTPAAIFVVNITGAFVIGLFMAATTDRFIVSPDTRRFVTVGILGGYTTFSTWMYETMQLLEAGDYLRAAANGVGSLVVGLLAVWLGLTVGRLI
jgi:CrcB protein